MKYLICSDIHSNLPALIKFKEIIDKYFNNGYTLICLGDIIGYGAFPSECIKIVKEMNFMIISGNHERMLLNPEMRSYASEAARIAIEWTESMINNEEKSFIEKLNPMINLDNKILLVHGSPIDPDAYILSSQIAIENIKYLNQLQIKLCFFGHSHYPGIFDQNGMFYYSLENDFILDKQEYYLINPGSIGQPRDGDSRGSFCLFDSDEMLLRFYRFVYDIDSAYEKIKENKLPLELGLRLYYGK